jgi:vacuolar-type H+-ATPase subunit F/Vma7
MPEELSKENPLAIVGDEDAVLGFMALGFKVYAVKEPQQCNAILDEVVGSRAAVCLVQDNIYSLAHEQINSYKGRLLPIFIPFAKSGKLDLLDNILKEIRLKATGAF